MPVAATRLRPALCRMAMIALMAAVPSACVSSPAGSELTGQPGDGVLYRPGVAVGGSGFGHYLAGRHAHMIHDTASAADYYARALKADPENSELLQRAYALMAAEGRMNDAADLARRLVAFDPEASIAGMLLAVRQVQSGDWAGAEKRTAALPRRGVGAFMGPLMTAWMRQGQDKTDAALEALQPLAANSNFAALFELHSALINDLAGRAKAADEHYRNVLASPAGLSLRSIQAAASFYQRTGKPDKAREALAKALGQQEDSALIDGITAGGQVLRPVASAKDGLAEAMFGTATSLRQNNALDIAQIFARMALDLQPDFPLDQVLIGDILQAQNRLADANKVYQSINPQADIWWLMQLRVAANLDEMEDVDGAMKLLEVLARQKPDRPDPLIAEAELLRKRKRFDEAAKVYDQAFARIPKPDERHWALYYSRGITLERSKQWQRAESDLLKALELQPEQPYVLNYLGYSWVEQGINLDKARKMIEKAVELRPNDGYIVDSLGWVMYRNGEFAKAVQTLERAIELRPEDPTINDHLGDALWQVGRRDEARFQWRHALTLKPEQDEIAAIERKLETGLETRQAATPQQPGKPEIVPASAPAGKRPIRK